LIEKIQILKSYLNEVQQENTSRTKYKWNPEKQKHEMEKGFSKSGTGSHGAFIAMQAVENNILGVKPFGVKPRR
jgi:hypothetical protein